MLATPRRGIAYPNPDRSDRPDIPLHIYNVAIAADGDVIYDQGTSASRGSAIHETSGGRLWWETDTDLLWYDDGTSWFSVGVNPNGSLAFTGAASQIAFTGENNAGNNVIRARVAGDAQDRITISTNGKISWGNGAAALDTFLYRSAVGVLNTDGSLIVGTAENVNLITGNATATRNAAGSVTWQSRVVGDVIPRLQILADGSMKWGSGAAATDVTLARIGANNLALGTSTQRGIFSIYGNAAANTGLQSLVTTDTQSRFQLHYDGGLNWGPGNAAIDTNLYRSGGGVLKTDGDFVVGGAYFMVATGDVNLRGETPHIYFGAADDTNLYRSAAGVLKTDGSLIGFGTPGLMQWDGVANMRVHRHPYGDHRHIESGAQVNGSITFVDAFGIAPNPALGDTSGGGKTTMTAISTTGLTFGSTTWSSYSIGGRWIAEGGDT